MEYFLGRKGAASIRVQPRSLPTCIHQKELLSHSGEGKASQRENLVSSIFFGGAGGDENKLSLDQKVTVLGLQSKVFTGAASLEAIGGAHQNRNGSAILLLKMYPSGILAHVHKTLSTKIFTVALL